MPDRPLQIVDSARVPVSETFWSVQGEGLLTGVPSWFMRFSGCNLRCTWCDTPYASWTREGTHRSLGDLIDEARRGASGQQRVRHAVITGGEPMVFSQLAALSSMLASPIDAGGAGMHITIETAGTAVPPRFLEHGVCDLMSISPKLAGSTPALGDPRDPDGRWRKAHESRRINVDVLQCLLDRFPPGHRQLKLVVTTASDLDEIESLLARLRGWTPTDILLMPEGTAEPSRESRERVLEACLARGYRYCHRLHITLFGHTRGT
jgi:7-carboxy-7-deazaguanine synthase